VLEKTGECQIRRVSEKDVLTEGTLEATPKLSLYLLALQCGISRNTLYVATKLLQLLPNKTTDVHSLMPPHCKARIQYYSWFQEFVFNGLLDLELRFYSDEAWFTLSRYVNSKNNRNWTTENVHAVCEVPVHHMRVVSKKCMGILCSTLL
jgi:hypothetical protein